MTKYIFISIVALFAISTFQSCKKIDSDVAPIITLTDKSVSESSVVKAGDTVLVQCKVVTGNLLTSVKLYTLGGTLVNTFTDINSSNIFSYNMVCYAGSQTYNIIVTDTVGFTSTLSFTIKTKPNIKTVSYGSVKDINGNSYKTISIGSQIWMAENLQTTSFRNGSPIFHQPIDSLWTVCDSAAYCTYLNTQDGQKISQFGNLYNWYAVSSSKGLCPQGWHIPGNDEWQTLHKYLQDYGYGYEGSGDDIAKSLAGKQWTESFNKGEIGNDQTNNNSSGFNAEPAGERTVDGEFSDIGKNTGFWVFDYNRLNNAYVYQLNAYSKQMARNTKDVHQGFSVRCVKD